MNTTVDPGALPVPEARTVRTTLYDLIVAIQEIVPEADNALVVATVVALLRSGRICEAADGHTRFAPAR